MLVNVNINDDLKLFALLKQGDDQAFEDIYNKYWYDLYKTAFKRLNDKEKCRDIVQNVFTDLWNRRNELEILNLQAYLHTAARFQALKTISKLSNKTIFIEAFNSNITSGLQSDENLLKKEAQKLVEQFIKALPAKRRKIFVMHYMDDLSTAHIAQELSLSQKTVQNQLTTASHALRLKLTHLFSYVIILAVLQYR
ncbi:sigma-70 family RNA polymerase sigma factor [Mucilaginibacter sp. PAMB04168]|uniref:RNA polymerase sigma factor n=1 Tax=Mucilaginibacter sp. PAMB04168 TaxID=3138567 RepID=UPI0031F694F0